MLLYALLALFIFFCLYVLASWLLNAEPKDILRMGKWLGLAGLLLLFLWLAFSGKLAVAFAVLPVAFVWFQRFRTVLGITRFLRGMFGKKQSQKAAPSTSAMTRQEALDLFGLDENASREEIKAAYHRLISEAHPDKGGTDEQAALINAARDVLLDD